jgi:hypothetical protein
MSDTDAETENSSTTSFGDISVCEEIGQLIEQCQSLHEYIHNSFNTLKNIHSLVENHNNITVTYNDWTGDFDELLELFHQEAINNIKDGKPNMFSQELLKMIDDTIFH